MPQSRTEADICWWHSAGMLIIIITLWTVDSASPKAAKRIDALFAPALAWVTRWLPLFYVPSLIQLPVSLTGFSGACLVQ